MEKISIDDFKKFDIRIGTIKAVKPHPNADKLYLILVDFGKEERDRQIIAGLKETYAPNELINKQVAVITNLEPVTIRGIESNGMLLAAVSPNNEVSILTTEKKIKNYSKVM